MDKGYDWNLLLQAKSILYSLVQVWKNFSVMLPHDIGPMINT